MKYDEEKEHRMGEQNELTKELCLFIDKVISQLRHTLPKV